MRSTHSSVISLIHHNKVNIPSLYQHLGLTYDARRNICYLMTLMCIAAAKLAAERGLFEKAEKLDRGAAYAKLQLKSLRGKHQSHMAERIDALLVEALREKKPLEVNYLSLSIHFVYTITYRLPKNVLSQPHNLELQEKQPKELRT